MVQTVSGNRLRRLELILTKALLARMFVRQTRQRLVSGELAREHFGTRPFNTVSDQPTTANTR